MSSFLFRHCEPGDAAAVAEVVAAHERACNGESAYSRADLESEWRTSKLAEHTWAALDGDRVVGYGRISNRGELWRADGWVHPDAVGRGLGAQLAALLEAEVRARGAKRVQSAILEPDTSARFLLTALGYREVRRFFELRIDLEGAPAAPAWPAGLRGLSFDPADARAFHAAQQEAFADHWEFLPRTFEAWSHAHLVSPGFDASLWSVVRDGDEIVAGAICRLEAYGGGWVDVLFTRAPWRRRGVGEALITACFARLWERGQTSIGLGVDAEGETGALRLYERMGMKPAWKAVIFEKALDG
jgi:ribosomal protein S18 acetylase RimI-like enzyme